jgi:sarcosine oxidase subunit gamma
MNAVLRISPLFDVQAPLARDWTTRERMQVVARFGADEAARRANAGIGDRSFLQRAGVKGAGAAAWLNAQGIDTPAQPNSFLQLADGTLVARLGLTEYLIEDTPGGTRTAALMAQPPGERVYPVPRFDAALELTGTQIPELLRQTCAFDFSTLAAPALVMTSMVGVGVTALTLDSADGPVVRLWCDGTWGGYLWLTLVEVAGDLGGGAVGVEA